MFDHAMAYPGYLKQRARELRVDKRLSLDDIAERLALPRTTVWYWIQDLPLARPRRATPGRRKGNAAMRAKYKRLRDEAYAQGLSEYDELVRIPTFRDFVVLDIAEGYKRNRNTVAIGNSDPNVVAVAASWLRALTSRRLVFSIQYHADQDLDELRTFWGDVLDIDGATIQFQRKSNSGKMSGRRWRCAHGVVTVRVHDTLLRSRLQAWIDRVRVDWRLDSADAFGAWRSLVARTVWGGKVPGSNPGAPM